MCSTIIQYVLPCLAMLHNYAMLRYVKLSYAELRLAMTSYGLLCLATPCYAMFSYAVL